MREEKSWRKKVEKPQTEDREREITFVPGVVVSIAGPYSNDNGDSDDNDHLTQLILNKSEHLSNEDLE